MDNGRPNAGGPGGNGEGRDAWREAELQRLVADVAARLRKSCPDLSDDEFSKLVLDIAQRQIRLDDLDSSSGPPPESRR